MKILKIAGVLFGLLLVVFFMIGVFFPSFEYTNSVTVQATPNQCWNIFQDTSKMKTWMPGFKSLTLKSGEFLQQGSVYELVIADGGERMIMEETLTSVRPAESVAYQLTNDVLTSDYTFTFEPAGNEQTQIQAHYNVTGKNLLWRSILFMSKGMMSASSQEHLEGIKKAAEQTN